MKCHTVLNESRYGGGNIQVMLNRAKIEAKVDVEVIIFRINKRITAVNAKPKAVQIARCPHLPDVCQ